MLVSAIESPPTQEGFRSAVSEVALRCPNCSIDLPGVTCSRCGLRLETCDGIVRALSSDRIAYYARFLRDYERIREAEGRTSLASEFYCGLPYRDVTGRNSDQWRIRARTFDALQHDVLPRYVPAGGRILDLGAGNCWMSFRLALSGYIPFAVDILTNPKDGLGAAVHYRDQLPELFPRFQAELSRLPFQSGEFDAVIFNASFHYAEDAESVFCEALRCAGAGGIVVISDTPWYSNDESGRQMVSERREAFQAQYGSASDSLKSVEYLTDKRLIALADRAEIAWTIHTPRYGLRWRLRPIIARLHSRREPSKFRIYVARKNR